MGVGDGRSSGAAAVVKVLEEQTTVYKAEIRREIRLYGSSSSIRSFGGEWAHLKG